MSKGIDGKPDCEHAWEHKGTSVGLWIPQCYLCGDFNNADIGQQIAKVKADALREFIQECRERGDILIDEIADTATEVIDRIEGEA